MAEQASLAIIGGSGLYTMPGLRQTREYNIETPFGRPSAPIVIGTLEGNTRRLYRAVMGSGTISHPVKCHTVRIFMP